MRQKCEHCGVKSKFSANRAGTEVQCPNCLKPMRLHDSLRNEKRRAEAKAQERLLRGQAAAIKAAEIILPKNPEPLSPKKSETVLKKATLEKKKSPSLKLATKTSKATHKKK